MCNFNFPITEFYLVLPGIWSAGCQANVYRFVDPWNIGRMFFNDPVGTVEAYETAKTVAMADQFQVDRSLAMLWKVLTAGFVHATVGKFVVFDACPSGSSEKQD